LKQKFGTKFETKFETKIWNKNLKQKIETKIWNKNLEQKFETNFLKNIRDLSSDKELIHIIRMEQYCKGIFTDDEKCVYLPSSIGINTVLRIDG